MSASEGGGVQGLEAHDLPLVSEMNGKEREGGVRRPCHPRLSRGYLVCDAGNNKKGFEIQDVLALVSCVDGRGYGLEEWRW